MKQAKAIKILNRWDKQGRYVFRKSDLVYVFDEQGRSLDSTLMQLVKNGVLDRVAHGVYLYAFSRNIGSETLGYIARNLRRGDYTFESLESALSQYGIISQIPIDRITLMTTGRSGEYRTPYGVIEFTHTKAKLEDIVANTIERESNPLPIANKHYAFKNLQSVGRNLTLVDKEELHAA